MIFYSWASQHNCVSTMDVKDHRVAFRARFMGTAYSVACLERQPAFRYAVQSTFHKALLDRVDAKANE
ncbi:hypothetical protein [Teredinibacter franksiae]|uniref:hypothetical protein n=1 Tax=Teredinibacter franksiae TaxID=2761453 RepID=UPI0016269E6A|nr:hypothetical protein [Teredinibacter franksiae]